MEEFMMKKLLVLMMAMVMILSLAACGGDQNSTSGESIELVEVTANGVSVKLPDDFKYAKTDENNGSMLYANEENTAVVTVGALVEDSVTSADITDDVLLASFAAGGISDATLESSRTVEHDNGTSVVGFGKGTLRDGKAMNSVIQFFLHADGSGYQAISYLFVVDAETSLEDMIEQVLPSVKAVK